MGNTLLWAILSCLLLAACTATPQPITVTDNPNLIVQIAYDPRSGSGHSHPVTITNGQLIAALRGLQLQGRDVVGGLGLFSDGQRVSAFTERDALLLAPYLSTGLAKASPHDMVTFHYVQLDSNRSPLVTSGGLFVRGAHLYLILANGKSSPSGVQYENAYEPNSRYEPLLPIARFKFTVGFIPSTVRIPTQEAKKLDNWDGYLDESKVVVLDLQRLQSSADTSPPVPARQPTTGLTPPSTPHR